MSRTQSQLWIHVLWSTRQEQRVLTPVIQPALLDQLRAAARNLELHLEAINAAEDHVHALLRLLPRMCLADAVDRLKGGSAHWINTLQLTPTHFAWEPAYLSCSINPAEVPDVRRYVHVQGDLHQHMSFAEEAIVVASRDPASLWRQCR